MHLNTLDPLNFTEQEEAFRASALQAAAFLQRGFTNPRQQWSRELDPIVGVSFTGAFTFFVKALGVDWLHWWVMGRPRTLGGFEFLKLEQEYLSRWKEIVHNTVWDYCDRHGLKRPNRCTTLKPEGCYLATYIRTTDQGVLFVDEIEPGIDSREAGFKPALDGFTANGDKILNGYSNGMSEVVRVTLANGRILECTPNHPLSMNGGWIAAGSLRSGDVLDFELGTYKGTQVHSLVFVDVPDISYKAAPNHTANCKTSIARYRYPSQMSPDLAYLIGVYWANGSFCSGNSDRARRIRLIGQHYSVISKVQQLWNQIFGIEATIHRCSNKDAYYFEFASIELGTWLEANGFTKIKSDAIKRIPESIRKSSVESIAAFFAGYADGDGCFYGDSFCIDSVSEEWLRHLQQVGEAIGLSFGLCVNSKRRGSFGSRPIYKIHLSKTYSLPEAIDLINKHSQKAQSKPVIHSTNIRCAKFPYKVVKVEQLEGLHPTYDIEVENSHWYYQGGIKSHNSMTLLTGVGCNGHHPPKSWRYIRRMTFGAGDPIALAALDYGYSVVPGQSDKDENGRLLDDPFDPRCTEWLIEVPVEEEIVHLFPDAAEVDPSQFSALAQFDWAMQVQNHYVKHNVSQTLEFRQNEIPELSERIHGAIQNDEGYISAALLARFDDNQTFPRLPFEPVSKERYEELVAEVLQRRKSDNFQELIDKYMAGHQDQGPQDSACDGGACELRASKPV